MGFDWMKHRVSRERAIELLRKGNSIVWMPSSGFFRVYMMEGEDVICLHFFDPVKVVITEDQLPKENELAMYYNLIEPEAI